MSTETFKIFGTTHLCTLGIIFLLSGLLVAIARAQQLKYLIAPLGWLLAGILIFNEVNYLIGAMIKGQWSYTWGLPLQLCDLTIILVAYCLVKHQPVLWELAYFWGLGGTMQAIITPDLTVTFPDYIYIKFFLTHGCIVVGVIFLAAGQKRKIDIHSVKRVFIITNIYAVFIGIFNYLFGTNYLYLCRKPTQASLLDHLGPWPWYILGLEGIFIVTIITLYLPYAICCRKGRTTI